MVHGVIQSRLAKAEVNSKWREILKWNLVIVQMASHGEQREARMGGVGRRN